jgi:hypothetical protein
MKLNRAEFLSAVIAIAATTTGCNKLKAELTQASPETPVAQPATPGAAAPGAPAGNIDQAPVRPDIDDTTGQGTSQKALKSPVREAGTLASPVKEAGLASPVKEAGLASPVKEAKIGSPIKETGLASPVKEAGSLTKKPSPVKEM